MKPLDRAPGPRAYFLAGNFPEFGRNPLAFFTRCAREYGDIVQFRLPGYHCCLLNHPSHIEQVLVSEHRNFTKHSFFWRHVAGIFGNGLLSAEGESWAQQRRMLQPAFHHEWIDSYAGLMVGETERLLAEWRDGETRDVADEMVRLTSRIMAGCLFGTDASPQFDELHAAFESAFGEALARYGRLIRAPAWIPTPANRRYRGAIHRLNAMVYELIHRREGRTENCNDILSALLQAIGTAGSRATDVLLRDELVTMYVAGYETTALTLSWAWYLLSGNPAADSNLADEIQAVLGGRRATVADLPNLRYAKMVVMESMRLYPPAYAVGREALHDCEIGGYRVPAGTTLFLSQWVTHRDPRYFDEPEKFMPERWTAEFARQLPKFAYFPFGGGPRHCIGNSFALMEAILLLVTVAQEFRFLYVPSHVVLPWPSMTLRPRHGVKVVLENRRGLGGDDNDGAIDLALSGT